MARSQFRHTVSDPQGNVIENARVYVYVTGTFSPVADLYEDSTASTTVESLVSNARGEVEGWLTVPKTVDVIPTDNSGTAFYPDTPAVPLSFTGATETVSVKPDIGYVLDLIAAIPVGTSSGLVSPGVLTAGSTHPSIASDPRKDVWYTNNSSSTSITTLDDGQASQVVTIIARDAKTTFVDGTGLRLAGNFAPLPEDTIRLVSDGTYWYELGRSANGVSPAYSPSAIFDHVYWAEGAEFAALGVANGAVVSTFPDEVSTNDAVQATAGNKPLFVSSADEFSGKPVIRFDGVDDFLQSSAWTSQAPPFAVAILGRWRTGINKTAGALADGRVATNKHAVAVNNLHYLHMDDGVDSSTFDAVMTKDMPHLMVVEFNLDSSKIWIDGRLEYSGAAANAGGAGTGQNSSVGVTIGHSAAASSALKALYGDIHFCGVKLGTTPFTTTPANLTDLVDWAVSRGVTRNDTGVSRRPRNYIASVSGTGSASGTFVATPTSGNLIGAWVSSSGVHASVAGPAGWVKQAAACRNNVNNTLSLSLWLKVSAGTESGAQTFTGTGTMQVQLFEAAGLLADTAAVLDSVGTFEDGGSTTSSLALGPVTPAVAPALLVAAVATSASAGEHRGSTGKFHTVLAGSSPRILTADKVVAAAAAESTTISWNGAARAIGVLATLKRA